MSTNEHFNFKYSSTHPIDAEATFIKAQECKDSCKPSKPCHVGIHWKALTERSQMSIHVPGFQPFFEFFASSHIGKISHQQHN